MIQRFVPICVCLVTALAGISRAADDAPNFECRWSPDPIKIDGKAEEPAWATAQQIDNFRRAWEGKSERPPKTSTKAKLLWDREYLYFFAEMQDTDLYASVTE